MASITLRTDKGSPLTIAEVDANFSNLNIDIGTRLPSSTYTAADILTKLKTVTKPADTSGLNSDTVGGLYPYWTNQPYSIVARDSNGSFAAQTITGVSLVGPLTGNVTGNVTGNLTGNSAGTHTGPVTGDVTGQTYGVHHGAVDGNVTGNLTGNVTGNVTGNLTGNVIGNVTGNVTGNVSGNAGTVTNGVYTNGSYGNPAWITSLAGTKVTAIPNSSLVNSSITINGSTVSLGGTATIASGFGTGQTYYDVTGSRDTETTYTNSTGNTIWVNATIHSETYSGEEGEGEENAVYGIVDGNIIWQERLEDPWWGQKHVSNLNFFVPPGKTYRIEFHHYEPGDVGHQEYTITVQKWVEFK
jgi:hypothetical protein